jgi:hypothetical protein
MSKQNITGYKRSPRQKPKTTTKRQEPTSPVRVLPQSLKLSKVDSSSKNTCKKTPVSLKSTFNKSKNMLNTTARKNDLYQRPSQCSNCFSKKTNTLLNTFIIRLIGSSKGSEPILTSQTQNFASNLSCKTSSIKSTRSTKILLTTWKKCLMTACFITLTTKKPKNL